MHQSVFIWGPLQLCFYTKSPNSNSLFSEPEIALLFPDIPGPLGPQGWVSLKRLLCQIETGGGPLQLCFYEEIPNSSFLFSELQIILLFQDFPWAQRALGCLQSKSLKIPKSTHLGPSSTLLLCKKSKIQILFSELEIAMFFPDFLWAPGVPVVPRNKKL